MHLISGKFLAVGVLPFLMWRATLPRDLKPLGQFGSQKDPSIFPPVFLSFHPRVKLYGFLKTVLTFLALVQYLCMILFDGVLYPAMA